jgi:2-polyprenyl-6-methoxyphenol hydroxylase-like FAD-dependent oxidoreductase
MAVVHRGVHVRLAHNTFHRMARIDLLHALHRFCRDVGVTIEFGRRVTDETEFAGCDLVIAADGANSTLRTKHRERFQPTLDVRPNWFAWYGTTRLFDPLSLIFRAGPDGLVIAHTYRFSATHSTFLVECDPQTWRRAGFDRKSEADSLAYCERVFADDLQGHALLSNRSNWFNYTIVSNRQWYDGNLVLLGDALRTGHPSVGSGTRLAMQDSIALFDAYRAVSDAHGAVSGEAHAAHAGASSARGRAVAGDLVPRMLAEFVRLRRPGSDALQQAAIRSTEWYENLGPKMSLDPVSFAYDYLTRSGRVTHADVRARDPALAAAYEALHPDVSSGA